MLNVHEGDIDRITEAIYHILKGRNPRPIELPADYPDNEIKQLAQYVDTFISQYGTFAEFLFSVSRGNLDVNIPRGGLQVTQSLKNLQANLLHLAWKTEQVAKGDFTQRVDFMGEFSRSFNLMVDQLASTRDELLLKTQELERASRTDALTGLLNRRGMLEALEREAHRSDRSKKPFLLMIADIDYFKRVNDSHGHDAGDLVLVEVAKVLLRHIRTVDMCARWGGEEFLLVLVDVVIPQALTAPERVRRAVEAMEVTCNGRTIKLTISAGISVCQPGEPLDACIKRGDLCLYRAKESGRNQTWIQETPEDPARHMSLQP